MTLPSDASNPQPKTWLEVKLHQTLREAQWIPAALAALLIAIVAPEWERSVLPGATPALFFAAVGLLALSVVLHAPPVFWRLPRRAKQGAWLLLLAAFFTGAATLSDTQRAYEQTPEGAKAAAAREENERYEADAARERAKVEEQEASQAAAGERSAENRREAEACFSGDRLPNLEKTVRDGLHNPAAFEHVQTEVIVPGSDTSTVMMTFRAENGFGAIRTAHVTAKLATGGCAVSDISEPEQN
jgi:hypothetical protein